MKTSGMRLSIDLEQYWMLPRGVRARFDCWLDAECLTDKLVVNLTLSEGEVIVTRCKDPLELDEDGRVVKYETRYPVRSLPPLDAFHKPQET